MPDSAKVRKLRHKADVQDGRREAFSISFIVACILSALVWVLTIGLYVIGQGEMSVVKAAVIVTTFPVIMLALWRHFTIRAHLATRKLNAAIGRGD